MSRQILLFVLVFLLAGIIQSTNAIECYYCSSDLHGSACKDPFGEGSGYYYKAVYNSSFTSCAKIVLKPQYGGKTARGALIDCVDRSDDSGSLWCCRGNYCNAGYRITFGLTTFLFIMISMIKFN